VRNEHAALAQGQFHDRITQAGEAAWHIQRQIRICILACNVCGFVFSAAKELCFKAFAAKPIKTEINRSARKKGA